MLNNTNAIFEAQFIKNLRTNETELKKNVCYKKRVIHFTYKT